MEWKFLACDSDGKNIQECGKQQHSVSNIQNQFVGSSNGGFLKRFLGIENLRVKVYKERGHQPPTNSCRYSAHQQPPRLLMGVAMMQLVSESRAHDAEKQLN